IASRPRASRGGRSTGRLRMNVLRPVGSGHVPIPLGESRSDHHLTRETPQRSNGSAPPVKISFSKNIYRFQTVSAQEKRRILGGNPKIWRCGRRANQGATEAAHTHVRRMRRTERPPHARFSCTVPSSIVSPSGAELANP